MRKKLLAIVMSLTMILAFMPAMAFADGSGVTSIEYRLSNGRTEVIMYEYEVDDYDYQPCQGDHLIVVTSGGETAYMYDEEEGEVFVSREGDTISPDDVQFELVPLVSDEGKYKITVGYEGKSYDIPVKVLGDNVSDITYTPKSAAITLYEGVDEIEEIDDDDNVVTYFDVRNAYDYLYGYGNDKVDIEYTDGTSETLSLDEFDNWDYVVKNNGEYIPLWEAQGQTPWEDGDTYDIYLKAKGKIDTDNKITVTIDVSPYKAFSFKQSEKYLYVFETDGLEYDSGNDEYVLNDTEVGYYGSEGDTLTLTRNDGSKVEFEYGRIENDPDYPRGWDGFVTTDASGNKVRPEREILFKDKPLRWTKDSDGHYINTTAKLTYMGAVSDEPVVSYAGNQVWFDPNGGDVSSNTAVPLGMSVNDLPNDWLNIIQPSRDGYTFSGWYEMDPLTGDFLADPFNFDTKIEEETFLIAKWEKAVCEHVWAYGAVQERFYDELFIVLRMDTCTKCGERRIGFNDVVAYGTSLPKVNAAKGKAGKKKLTVKWKKVSKKNRKKIDGIEIQVSGPGVDKDNLYIAGKGKTSKTIKVPMAKTKYKYRVRAYKGSGRNRELSIWSGWKTVKVK